MDKFYSKLRVNNTKVDDGRLLNLNNKQSLVRNLGAYTMDMIADKNPEAGNQVMLKQIAGEMHKK